mgnify:CR=1 FL=1
MPIIQIPIKKANNFGFTALRSIISEGRDKVVTAIINDSTVPSCAPLASNASATGIVRLAKERLACKDTDSVLSSVEDLTAKAVFDAARDGDETAKELVDELCTMLGTALANIAAVVDPEIFVIGGGVSRAGEILINGIREHYEEKAFHACRTTEIALATLGNDAGMYGCVRLLF